MMGVSYDGTDEGRVEMMAKIPMVAFSPRDVHTRGRGVSLAIHSVHLIREKQAMRTRVTISVIRRSA